MTGPQPGTGLKLIVQAQAIEAALWRRWRYNQDTECRLILFDQFSGFARKVAASELRRRPSHGLERGDFEQLAFGGLLEAIDRYDPLQGPPFEAFARPRIVGAIADGAAKSSEGGSLFAYRGRIELERLQSLEATARATNDHISALSELVAMLAIGILAETAKPPSNEDDPGEKLDVYETVAWRDLQMSVLSEIQRLPAMQRQIIEQHYLQGVAFEHIARLLGISKSRVSQIHRAALTSVRERLKIGE